MKPFDLKTNLENATKELFHKEFNKGDILMAGEFTHITDGENQAHVVLSNEDCYIFALGNEIEWSEVKEYTHWFKIGSVYNYDAKQVYDTVISIYKNAPVKISKYDYINIDSVLEAAEAEVEAYNEKI